MSNSFSVPERQALVAQWRASGLAMFQLAKQHGVSFTKLHGWAARETKPTFARVELAYVGHRISVPPGFDPTELRRLMEALC